MPLELVTIPCRTDNYAFLIHNAESGATALIDAPEAAPIKAVLAARGWALTDILLTHHHDDHTCAVPQLRTDGVRVVGASADVQRLPTLDLAVADGDSFDVAGATCDVLDVSGHTLGHIAFHLPGEKLAFTADSLMALGCGRLFEGTAEQMWASLSKLRALPADTLICSGHEYTAANARFAVTVDPDNDALKARHADITSARASGEATVPSLLSLEQATNPFLRPDNAAIRAHLGLQNASDTEVFAKIRALKDQF